MAAQKRIVLFTFLVLFAFMEETKLTMAAEGGFINTFFDKGTHQEGGGHIIVFHYFPPQVSQSTTVKCFPQ